jgi:hypothetical protein
MKPVVLLWSFRFDESLSGILAATKYAKQEDLVSVMKYRTDPCILLVDHIGDTLEVIPAGSG